MYQNKQVEATTNVQRQWEQTQASQAPEGRVASWGWTAHIQKKI